MGHVSLTASLAPWAVAYAERPNSSPHTRRVYCTRYRTYTYTSELKASTYHYQKTWIWTRIAESDCRGRYHHTKRSFLRISDAYSIEMWRFSINIDNNLYYNLIQVAALKEFRYFLQRRITIIIETAVINRFN